MDLMSLTALMLGKNLILEGDANFLVKAAATYNYLPSLYKLFRTNGYQKWHNQHHKYHRTDYKTADKKCIIKLIQFSLKYLIE